MSASKKEQIQISSYSKRLKDNVKSILDNYGEILRASKVSHDEQRVTESQVIHVENEIEVRAANIVRAAEALSKLVSELKEYLILNDFSTINEATTRRITELQRRQKQSEAELQALYSAVAAGTQTGGGVARTQTGSAGGGVARTQAAGGGGMASGQENTAMT